MNLKSQLLAALCDSFDVLMYLPKQNPNKREEMKQMTN